MEAELTRPAPVWPGATVAVVSPCSPGRLLVGASSGTGTLLPRVAGVAGPRDAPQRPGDGRQVGLAESRADDLHAAFSDADVTVVLAAIGGDHAVELLPHLDCQLIRANPKLFQGYSDATVLHWALLKHAGLSSFYGPALFPELGEHPTVLRYTDTWLRAAWFESAPSALFPRRPGQMSSSIGSKGRTARAHGSYGRAKAG